MLASKGTRFLTGDTMCCFDCELMPKLQHIRVAGEVKTNQCQSVSQSVSGGKEGGRHTGWAGLSLVICHVGFTQPSHHPPLFKT